MCAPICLTCAGDAYNCLTCANNRENAPYCTCKAGTAENINGDCVAFDASRVNDASYQASFCPPPATFFYEPESNMANCLPALPGCKQQTLNENYELVCLVPGCQANEFYDDLLQACV